MARHGKSRATELWRERLDRFAAAEVSVRDFCAREEVSEASFYQWRKRLARERADRRRAAKPAFQEVRVTPVAGVLSIEFPGGARLEAPADHLELARAVVRELALAAPADDLGGA